MALISVKNIGDQLIVTIDGKDVESYEKTNIDFSIDENVVTMLDDGVTIFSEPSDHFIDPKESSSHDLFLLLNAMLTTVGTVENITGVKTVGKGGAVGYTSIKSAVDASVIGDVIIVYSGTYIEDPITMKAVTIFGNGEVTVTPNNISSPLFTAVTNANIIRIKISGVTNDACVYADATVLSLRVENCDFGLSDKGVHCVGATNVFIEECKILTGIVTGLYCDTNADVKASNIFSFGTTLAFVDNSSTLFIHNSGQIAGVNGFYTDNSGKINFSGFTTKGTQNSIRLDNSSEIVGSSFVSDGGTSKDIWQEDSSSIVRITGGILNHSTLDFSNLSNIDLEYNSNVSGDKGYHILGELKVGSPEQGSESVFGEGDSYTRGMLVYTETDSGTQVNVTSSAQSDSGSTFAIPGVVANNEIYISSDRQDSLDYVKFFGYKVIINTAVTIGGGEIVHEYWNGAWTEFSVMATDAQGSYLPKAQNVFGDTVTKQVRFNNNITTDWAKNDPITSGTNRFWIRIRIKTAATVAPILEQIKIHSNRSEINADGWMEYFGLARPLGSIDWNLGLLEAAGSSPGNQDLAISNGLDVGRQENLFQNAATDRNGFTIFLPFDVDTSTPIHLTFAAKTDNASAGNIEWTIRWGYTSNGDNVYTNGGGEPATGTNEQETILISTAPTAADTMVYYSTGIDISSMVSRTSVATKAGDILWLTIERQGGDAADTHTGDVALIQLSGHYARWCNGGHL